MSDKIRRGPQKRRDSPHRKRNAPRVAEELLAARAGTTPPPRLELHQNGAVPRSGAVVASHPPALAPALAPDGKAWDPRWSEPRGPLPILRAAAPAVAQAQVDLALSGESESVRQAAQQAILDRVLGRAVQSVQAAVVTAGVPADTDAIDALVAAMLAPEEP